MVYISIFTHWLWWFPTLERCRAKVELWWRGLLWHLQVHTRIRRGEFHWLIPQRFYFSISMPREQLAVTHFCFNMECQGSVCTIRHHSGTLRLCAPMGRTKILIAGGVVLSLNVRLPGKDAPFVLLAHSPLPIIINAIYAEQDIIAPPMPLTAHCARLGISVLKAPPRTHSAQPDITARLGIHLALRRHAPFQSFVQLDLQQMSNVTPDITTLRGVRNVRPGITATKVAWPLPNVPLDTTAQLGIHLALQHRAPFQACVQQDLQQM